MTWDEYLIDGARWVATKSKDRSTKVGALVVGPDHEIRSTGYNNFCRGMDDDIPERHERPAKYLWTEHAERNAVYNATLSGVSLKGCTMYMNFAPSSCCADCARAIIQSGIVCVIGPLTLFSGKGDWTTSSVTGVRMMIEADVQLYVYENSKRIPLSHWLDIKDN